MSGDTEELLYQRPKRNGRTLMVKLRTHKGSAPFLDIREWASKEEGPIATGKGSTMPPEWAREVGEALIAFAALERSDKAPAAS